MGFLSVKPSWLYSRFPRGSVGLALLVWMFNGNQIAAKCSEPY